MHKRRCEAPPTHVYHIKKRCKLLNTRYTQYESICRRDVKLSLHIGNTYQKIFNFSYSKIFFKGIRALVKQSNFKIPIVKKIMLIPIVNKHYKF